MSPTTRIYVEIKWYKELLDLADLFQAPTIAAQVMQSVLLHMSETSGKPVLDAWDVFKLAAQRDDELLAKAAIRSFHLSGYDVALILGGNKPAFFEGIPPRYIYALMYSTFQQTALRKNHDRSRHVLVRDLSQIARDFTLS